MSDLLLKKDQHWFDFFIDYFSCVKGPIGTDVFAITLFDVGKESTRSSRNYLFATCDIGVNKRYRMSHK